MKIRTRKLARSVLLNACLFSIAAAFALGQVGGAGDVHVRIAYPPSKSDHRKAPAVVWLTPFGGIRHPAPSPGRFTLLQKNRMFSPHVLVVPVGSTVSFPNADPFFHNVFSLFNGKRFDLGLYEAGTSKDVVFSREGVSYIFCNIHSEMSAVILSLATPYYAVADSASRASITNVAPGEYELHTWIEGMPDRALQPLTRRVEVKSGSSDAVLIELSEPPSTPPQHFDKFGQPYDRTPRSPY